MTKRIGILTSGGDCAGLNAVIRAVVHRAIEGYGWQVVGIHEGTQGLLDRPIKFEELTLRPFTGALLRMAGTILGTTNKGDPFAYPMPDGSLRILRELAQKGGINLVGIPKTIDNDLGHTESSIGYDTAVDVATEALDRLQPTAASHSRVMILEVMGRDAGHIALASGIAGGADVIVIPEIPYTMEGIAKKIDAMRRRGRNFALVIVAEAVHTPEGEPVRVRHTSGGTNYGGIGHVLGDRIAQMTGAETRVTVLGHVQRGGVPTPRDRLMATAFGVHAVDLIAEERFDRMVAWSERRVLDVPLEEAIAHYHPVDVDGALVRTARGLGIYIGDA